MNGRYEALTIAVAALDQVILQLEDVGYEPEELSDLQARRNQINRARVRCLGGDLGEPYDVAQALRDR